MTRRRLSRHWALLVVLYLAADFMDPSIPGAFFFDSKELFVDGAVQVKSNVSKDHVVTDPPMSFGGAADYDDRNAAAKVRALACPSLPRQARWSNLKHDDSASFAFSSPPDASPPPPLP